MQVVAIDLSGAYRSGIRTALPNAQIAADPFPIVPLANKMVAQIRRRHTSRRYGRRGRQGDPEYAIKRLLMRNHEDLTPTAMTTMGHTTPALHQIRHRLTEFFPWCATFADIPEIATFAETISRWRHEIATAVHTGVSHATSEGINRVAKLVARIAYGFRNPINQRRRVRYAATRTSRRKQSPSVPTNQPLPVIT